MLISRDDVAVLVNENVPFEILFGVLIHAFLVEVHWEAVEEE